LRMTRPYLQKARLIVANFQFFWSIIRSKTSF